MSETYSQMKTRLYHARGEECEACRKYVSRETIQAHHAIHRNVAPHMVQDDDNVILLCWMCHALDAVSYIVGQGSELHRRLIRIKGQEWYDNLRAKAATV